MRGMWYTVHKKDGLMAQFVDRKSTLLSEFIRADQGDVEQG